MMGTSLFRCWVGVETVWDVVVDLTTDWAYPRAHLCCWSCSSNGELVACALLMTVLASALAR